MMKVENSILIDELMTFLEKTEFFSVYPTHEKLRRYLNDAVSDSDKIRVILRDEYVQRELFPDYAAWKRKDNSDPLEHYLTVRIANL